MASTSTPVWTIGSLLTWTTDFFAKKAVDEPRLSAELLLAHSLQCSRMALYTQYERIPPEDQIAAFRELVKQRANHVPVAYLIGKAWFFSMEFAVTRDVLIPRPDTETLVEFVVQHARQRPELSPVEGADGAGAEGGAGSERTADAGRGSVILDLCTGSGAIPIALAHQLPTATFVATDISPRAIAVAQQNAATHKVAERITFLAGDLFDPLETMPAPSLFHIVTANPPYIPTAELQNLPPTVRDHEPRLALDGGPDGLSLHRRILQGIKRYLHPGALLILEMQFDQGAALNAAFAALGGSSSGGGAGAGSAAAGNFSKLRTIRDATGHPRCIVATYTP